MKIVLTTLNAKFIHSSLALRYLKVSCRDAGAEIKIKEYTINNEPLAVLGDIYREKPDVVGLACYIWNIEQILSLAQMIRKVLPQTKIILGGPEVSFDPLETMNRHSWVDYIVTGEGEKGFRELILALKDGGSVEELEGLAFRRNGVAGVNGAPAIINDLNTLPFPYDEADMEQLKDKIIYYESSRGCPFRCQYCLSSATQGVRYRSRQQVLQELAFFIRHDVKQVKFVDRTFNARKEHYLPIFQFLAGQDCRTNFHFEMAIDSLDEETLQFLRQIPPGRFQFEIGVQSTYEPALNAICRHNDWPSIVAKVNRIQSYNNIHMHLDLIAGLPQETYERFAGSFNAVYALQPDMLQIGFLKLLKGSGIHKAAKQYGYVAMDTAPYEVLANNYINYEQVRQLKNMETVFNLFYNSGRMRLTTAWIIRTQEKNAFSFYSRLARYWEEKELFMMAYSAKSLYRHFFAFCQDAYGEMQRLWEQLLKMDALLTDQGTIRPDLLAWNGEKWAGEKNDFWRDKNRLQRYLPGYSFTTWRDNKKKFLIEVFDVDIPEYLRSGTVVYKPTALLFSYAGKEASYQLLPDRDFWLEGETATDDAL
ncbi:B12-binding domain-containing radical SAM protein [Lucifera butyrica]|uniref:B12-binding domain-containing radical SAM protein n=1 Tax=Lucifera butyrica TaxID=1351585 RepID=UPI000F020D90|nr:B12-binding domain-containing radical SAM protein [Lucifera butyrica]